MKKNIIDVKIYNQLGQILKTSSLKTIDISNFNQGIYIVKVIDENSNTGIQKVIKE